MTSRSCGRSGLLHSVNNPVTPLSCIELVTRVLLATTELTTAPSLWTGTRRSGQRHAGRRLHDLSSSPCLPTGATTRCRDTISCVAVHAEGAGKYESGKRTLRMSSIEIWQVIAVVANVVRERIRAASMLWHVVWSKVSCGP